MDEARSPFGATRPTGVFQCLEAVAAANPSATALHDEDLSLSFAELHDAALALVDEIEGLPEGPVAFLSPSRASTVATQFGLAAAPRVSVPLDPTFPLMTLQGTLSVTGAVAVVSPPDLAGLAREIAGSAPVVVWSPDPRRAHRATGAHLGSAEPHTVYFTSGSTGGPKGIIHTQRNWVDAGMSMVDADLSDPQRRYLLMSPMAFAAAGIITSFALFGGSSLSIYDARGRGLSDLPGWVRDNDITCLVSIPSAVRAVIAATGGRPLEGINQVIYGGEMVTREDVLAARSLSEAVDVTLLYVSTELGLVTSRTIRAEDPVPEEEPIHSGWPYPRGAVEQISLVDDNRKPCGPGEAGQIQVTARRLSWFVGDDGYAPGVDGEMVLDTGDIGRLLPDGGLQILGRSDQLVKIRGFRVDQAQVESHIRTVEGVADVCVVVGQTGRGTPQLVAHVVAESGAHLAPGELREQLKALMPAYMLPARIFLADALPRLRNGKVDRVVLKLSATASDPAGSARELSTPTEKAIAEAFALVLGIDIVGADDDFFDLGGSSLEVAELLIQLQDRLGMPVPASTLTHHSTPEQLAARLRGPDDDRSSLLTIQGATAVGRPTLHLVYDLHGSPFRMRRLAHALGADQPVSGFECPLIYGEPGTPTSLQEIASIHVRDLLDSQPEGPYHLCGYSVGSVVMFEMASQLVDAGHEVGLAGAVDFGPVYFGGRMPRGDGPKPPGTYPRRAPSRSRGMDRLRFHTDQMRGLSAFERGAHLSRLVRLGREYEMGCARADLARHGRVRPELRPSWTWYNLLDAAYDWTIPTVPIALTLFLCDQTADGNIKVSRRVDHQSRRDRELGWTPYVDSVDVRDVIGYHNALVEEPYVDGVGAAIRAALDGWSR